MKKFFALFTIIFLVILTACEITIPGRAPIPVTMPVNPFVPSATPIITQIPPPSATPTLTPTATETPTPTATITPELTATSPYPVNAGTQLPDIGFSEITLENIMQLRPVYNLSDQKIWQTAISADGQKLFAATSTGMLVVDRQGQKLADWPSILTVNLPCESCLSVNRDGSRFALMTRNAGKWEARVYNVDGANALLLLSRPIEIAYQNASNQARIALSPDGLLLAYSAGSEPLLVVDMGTLQTVLTHKGEVTAALFLPDGATFAVRRGREMLFWKTATWKTPANLLLPADDTPYAFSPDGKSIAIAMFARVRVYALDTLTPTREITVQPINAVNRIWQITFVDTKTLRGYGVRWDTFHTKATVDIGEWNLETGETTRMETSETDSPDALSALWGASVPLTPATSEIEVGQYHELRFVSADNLLVNGLHTACWIKLSIGDKTCFNDPEHFVYASDGTAFKEIRMDSKTLLQTWDGENIYEVGPYPVLKVNKNGEFMLLNVNNFTTDLYSKGKTLPEESIAGSPLGFAENNDLLVYSGLAKANVVSITLVDKKSHDTLFLKKENFILKPIAISNNGKIYLLKRDLDRAQSILQVIDPKTYKQTDVVRLSLPAEPEVLTLSPTGLFAFGLQDGSILIMSQDGQQKVIFQSAASPIARLSFTPDGRFLAVASAGGVKVFAVLP